MGLPQKTTAAVSLAGQNVLDPKKRWTPGFKQNIWSSRVNTTLALAQACLTSPVKPNVFVSISGVGMFLRVFELLLPVAKHYSVYQQL